jgi:hypothetical protein
MADGRHGGLDRRVAGEDDQSGRQAPMLDGVEQVEDAKPLGLELGDVERNRTGLEPLERLRPVPRRRGRIPLAPEQFAQGFSRSILVIDDEYMTT